jgi:hypothetical protein
MQEEQCGVARSDGGVFISIFNTKVKDKNEGAACVTLPFGRISCFTLPRTGTASESLWGFRLLLNGIQGRRDRISNVQSLTNYRRQVRVN